MNITLVLIVGFVESIIFIWLIQTSFVVSKKLNIFEYVSNWFEDRPIILPSICLLIFPFFIFFGLDKIGYFEVNQHTIKSINSEFLSFDLRSNDSPFFEWLRTVFTVITTAFGIFINNKYLENSRNKKEQKKLANILIPIIEGHIVRTMRLDNYCKLFSAHLDKQKLERIHSYENSIKNDSSYQDCLAKIGVYNTKITRAILEYSQYLNYFIDELNMNIENKDGLIHIDSSFTYRKLDKIVVIRCRLVIIILSKLILEDEKLYQDEIKSINDDLYYIYLEETKKSISISDYSNIPNILDVNFENMGFDNKEILKLVKSTDSRNYPIYLLKYFAGR